MKKRILISMMLILVMLFTAVFASAEETELTEEELLQYESGVFEGFTYYYNPKTGQGCCKVLESECIQARRSADIDKLYISTD